MVVRVRRSWGSRPSSLNVGVQQFYKFLLERSRLDKGIFPAIGHI
jgi:hypothetical protein